MPTCPRAPTPSLLRSRPALPVAILLLAIAAAPADDPAPEPSPPLFDPADPGSPVFLPDAGERTAWLLGAAGDLPDGDGGVRPWRFAPADPASLRACSLLLADLPPDRRGDPAAVAEHLRAAVAGTVLRPRLPGEAPVDVSGTDEVAALWLATGESLPGDAALAAGVLVGLLRAAGIPARPEPATGDSALLDDPDGGEPLRVSHVWVSGWIGPQPKEGAYGAGSTWTPLDAWPDAVGGAGDEDLGVLGGALLGG